MVGCLRGGLGDDRQVQAPANYFSDVSNRHDLVGDPVIPGSRGTLLRRQPEEVGSIEPVHRGPAVEPVTHIRRNALLACDADNNGNEAVIAPEVTSKGRSVLARAEPSASMACPSASQLAAYFEKSWLKAV